MKKEQIVSAAYKMFSNHGYKNVSMDDIAKEANVTKRTVYKYFESKEQLLAYIIKQEINNIKINFESIELKNQSLEDTLNEAVITFFKNKQKNKLISQLLLSSHDSHNPLLINYLNKIDDEVYSYIKNKLIVAQNNNQIIDCDVDVIAYLIQKMYIALMFDFKKHKINDEKLKDNIVLFIKKGLMK